MKKNILTAGVVALLCTAASCVKEYDCHCTYVANTLGPNAGQPNKEEHSTVEARIQEDAEVDCAALEGKYTTQFYSGTCTASR